MATSNKMSHDPTPGPCANALSNTGREQSNLMLGSASKSYPPMKYDEAIIGWLIDNSSLTNPEVVGHRRLIINPFLTSTALGIVNAQHPVGANENINSAALWGITGDVMGKSDCENDFVAYPYENYPPAWVDKSFYLSWGPIPNPNFWWSPNVCNFGNAKIEMTDSNGNKINIHDIEFDYDAWGSFQHNISWKADGLKDSIRYNVTISNIQVNGQPVMCSYWFKLTDEPIIPPPPPNPLAEVPKLVAPANNAINMESPITFKWNKSENAEYYRLEGSLSSSFINITFQSDDITDTTYEITNELSTNANYYWRVEAYNIDNVTSGYSEVWKFTTKEIIPDPPTTIYPLANNNNVARRDDYIWSSVDEAITYTLQISTSENFTTLVIDQKNIYDTTYHLTEAQMLDEFTDYYWRVKTILLSGSETEWSVSVKYKTNDIIDGIVEELSGVVISCYPNPFNECANIILETENTNNVNVKIEIYNLLGIKIADLYDGVIEGMNNFKFKPPINESIYFCKIQIGNSSKIILLNFVKN
jgi:hypothetical protein